MRELERDIGGATVTVGSDLGAQGRSIQVPVSQDRSKVLRDALLAEHDGPASALAVVTEIAAESMEARVHPRRKDASPERAGRHVTEDAAAAPVGVPVVPAPAEAAEPAQADANAEVDAGAADEQALPG